MSEWKEVWYVWDGKKLVFGASHIVYDSTGIAVENCKKGEELGTMKDDGRISHYTIGQKRRRVECQNCLDGLELIDIDDCENEYWDKCQACSGTGKTWEYSE